MIDFLILAVQIAAVRDLTRPRTAQTPDAKKDDFLLFKWQFGERLYPVLDTLVLRGDAGDPVDVRLKQAHSARKRGGQKCWTKSG